VGILRSNLLAGFFFSKMPVAATEENAEDIEFRVTNLRGDTSIRKAAGIRELRLKLAIDAGVLFPCIVLMKHEKNKSLYSTSTPAQVLEVEDGGADNMLSKVFHGESQPFFLTWVNNEESMKHEVVHKWTGDTWASVLKAHILFGDENVVTHAHTCIQFDDLGGQAFREKMDAWIKNIINAYRPRFTGQYDDGIAERRERHRRDMLLVLIGPLMACNVNLCVRGKYGFTWLHRAAQHGDMDLLDLWINAGLPINMRRNMGATALSDASRCGHRDAVKALLHARADVLRATAPGECTPLHYAASEGHDLIADLLIKARADVNSAHGGGYTPLHEAARKGYVKVIRVLLREGASIEVKSNEAATPVEVACNEAIRKVLVGD